MAYQIAAELFDKGAGNRYLGMLVTDPYSSIDFRLL
jgi:hypothetical protein